jgi:hypothetical protein
MSTSASASRPRRRRAFGGRGACALCLSPEALEAPSAITFTRARKDLRP